MTRTPLKFLAAAAGVVVFLAAAQAAPVNLVANGSFEDGLGGWTHGGTFVPVPPSSTTPVVTITYGAGSAYPSGAFGEPVASPANATLSPDAPGTQGAYFVDDGAIGESLTQQIFLAAGSYRIGFDAYAPNNGYGNYFDASFSAQIAGVTLANYLVSSQPAATWVNFSGLATVLSSGIYDASFLFNTSGVGNAKDLLIDRVYVLASDETGGQVIPEPATLALVGIALAGLAVTRRGNAA